MEKSCSECPEPTLAQSLCTLCNKWLCYQCTDLHQHRRAAAASQCADVHAQQRPGADPHQKGCSSLPAAAQGPGSHPCTLLMCHSHRQEPLELFCESCDLLCCSSCHLSSHKNHRVVQIGKALQDQQWLFERLMAQVEERRSAVESNAKQIEDRLRGVKIAHRKAENQIKMAKMIMMNELNKRANLLIEQLEKISEDFQQCLGDQLQGAIETCSQLDHVQKFIAWATTHHCRGPVLFSRALISYQMQQLLEQSLHSDSWSPVKIKFNWDASYWTKQMSSLGQLSVEGGNCAFSPSLACSSVLRPQPISCLAVPPGCHRGRESGCRYQLCCEPQVCCLHSVASPGDLEKGQLESALCNSSCVQPARLSVPLHQTHQLPRCWDPDGLSQCPPPSSPAMGPLQLSCGRGSQPQTSAAQPLAKPYLYHPNQGGGPESLPQSGAEPRRLGHCQGKLSPQGEEGSGPAAAAEEVWEERRRPGEALAQAPDSREVEDQELRRRDRRELSPVPPHRGSPAAELSTEQQRSNLALRLGDHRGSKRSSSLEVPVTNQECVSDAQSSRLSPGVACARRERRSQSIPAELAAPSTSAYCERPPGCVRGQETGAANKNPSMDSRVRRASDGVLSAVTEASSGPAPSRGLRSLLLTYKTEPDHSFTYATDKNDYDAKEKSRSPRNGHGSSADVQKDPGKARVPVVCLERLKILVSQLPPHGRRQSDPLPTSGAEAPQPQSTWQAAVPEGASGGVRIVRTTRSFTAPPYTERLRCPRPAARETAASPAGRSPCQPSSDPKHVAQSYSAPHVDSDSDPRTASEGESESSSEAEQECLVGGKSAARGADTDPAGDSERSFEYEGDPESDAAVGSDDSRERDAEAAALRAESDSDRPPDSQGSAESELDVDSEAEGRTDEPQPLRSDPEEDSHVGRRPLLIANPAGRRAEEQEEEEQEEELEEEEEEEEEEGVRPEQDSTDMESEDFCAVCLIGGDLLCCDRCPKVFHLSCHVPPLQSFPSGDWVCSLCRDVVQPEVQYDCESASTPAEHPAATHGLAACDQRKCERLTLLILSNVLSAPFQEPVSPLARHYYQIIKRPIDLSVIRAKLNKRTSHFYSSPEEFVADICLMFRNCAKFNYPDSEVAQAGRSLEAFFIGKLKEVFPDRIFPVAEAESDSDEYDEAYRAAEGGFPWPERREQCHRKRKRRNSLKSRRNHF